MILVTAAAGRLGRTIVTEVLRRVPPYQLAVTTRHPEKLTRLERVGVSVRKVDYADPDSLREAFHDVDSVLLVSSDADVAGRTAQHECVIESARIAGVRRLIYTSFLDADPASPFPFSAAHEASEQALLESGLAWTILRVNDFAESLVECLNGALDAGVFPNVSPRGRASYVSRRDVAEAAAAVLIGGGHERRIYEITGPAALSGEDVAAMLTRIEGRTIEPMTTPVRDYVRHLKRQGLKDYRAEAIGGLHVAIDEGRLSKVSNDLKRLTGHPPNLIEEALREALMRRYSQAA